MPWVHHRGLHQDHRAEGNVEVEGKDQELLDLVSGTLLQCRVRGGFGCHDGLLRDVERHSAFTLVPAGASYGCRITAPCVAQARADDYAAL